MDHRFAKANTTMVNVDSQMSGVTGGRVSSRALHGRGEAEAHCDVMRVMQQATLLEIVLVDAEVVVVTGVVIGATLGRSKLTFVLRWTFRLKMWARSVRLLTMSLKWMK